MEGRREVASRNGTRNDGMREGRKDRKCDVLYLGGWLSSFIERLGIACCFVLGVGFCGVWEGAEKF